MAEALKPTLVALIRHIAVFGVLVALGACSSTGTDSSAGATASYVSTSGSSSGPQLQMVAELPPPPNTDNGIDQLIAPNDTLSVNVFQVTELNRDVQVDSSGHITLPLVGLVPAAGKTVQQLQAEITRLYGSKYLQSPDVTVSMKESAGERATVDGEVARAGIYPTTSQSTLVQLVAQAGGLSSIADADKVFVFRNFGDRRLVAQYSVQAIREGRRIDPKIFGGDTVIVFASGTKVAMENLKSALGLTSSAISLGRL